jgi:hypothetical protein
MKISTLYYLLSVFAALGVLALSFKLEKYLRAALEHVFLLPIVFLSVVLVYRVDGVDIDNYRYIYNQPWEMGWDYGWAAINRVSGSSGIIGFSEFIFFIFLLEIFILSKICKKLDVKFLLFFVIYLLHLAIVRDFSQLRVGFAVAIMLYGVFCTRAPIKWIVVLIALTVHLTTLVILICYFLHIFISRMQRGWRTQLFWVFLFSAAIYLVGRFLASFAGLDDRISIYMGWDADGYGARVESYATILFFVLLIGLAYMRYTLHKTEFSHFALVSFWCAVLIYISFSSYQIFAARLSNVAISLYPFVVAAAVADLSVNRRYLEKLILHKEKKIIILFMIIGILISILSRDGNSLIIDQIQPKLLLY